MKPGLAISIPQMQNFHQNKENISSPITEKLKIEEKVKRLEKISEPEEFTKIVNHCLKEALDLLNTASQLYKTSQE